MLLNNLWYLFLKLGLGLKKTKNGPKFTFYKTNKFIRVLFQKLTFKVFLHYTMFHSRKLESSSTGGVIKPTRILINWNTNQPNITNIVSKI